MDPKDPEEFCNSGPDEVTIAREKKRSRRVSFAEITSVHVFDRDEDGDTSSDTKPSFENREVELSSEPLGFLRDFVDSDDSKELSHNEDDDEEEDEEQRGLFVRNMDSPGSTIGSTTSNDEDNFFGPVSASFIRSGRLSDSAASDNNHDITLDSTAFSLHFRSLMRSESDGNLKTPTRTDLSFEVKTPTDNSCTNSGSFMVLTGVDKPTPQRSVSGGISSGGNDSNDMSLIEDNPHRYDYGRISPTLDALLAEGSKCTHDVSVPDQIYTSKSLNYINGDRKFATPDGFGSEFKVPKYSGDNKLEDIDTRDTPAHGGSAATLTDQISYPSSSSTKETVPADVSSIGHQNQIVDQLPWGMPSGMDMEPASDVLKVHGLKLDLGGGNFRTFTPLNEKNQMDMSTKHDCADPSHVEDGMREEFLKGGRNTPDFSCHTNQCYESPREGSISSLHAKRQQMFIDSAVLSRSELITTPFSRKPPLPSMNKQNIRHGASISSIYNSTSKFKLHGTSPIGAMLDLGDDNTKPVISNYFRKSPSLAAILDESNKDPNLKQINSYVSDSGESLLNGVQENREQTATVEMDAYYVGTPKSIRMLTPKEESVAALSDREGGDQISAGMFCNDQRLTAATLTLSPLSALRKDVQIHSSISHNLTKGTFISPRSDSSLKIRSEFEGKDQVPCTPINSTHSALQQLERKQSASPEPKYISGVQMLSEQYDKIVASGYAEDLRANIVDVIHSNSVAEGPQNLGSCLKDNRTSDTLLKENKVHGTSTSVVNNAADANNFNKSTCITSSEVLRHNFQMESGKIGSYETPLRYRSTLNSQSGSPGMNFLTRTDPTRFKEKLPENASSFDSASPYLRRTSDKNYVHKRILTATRLEKRLLEQLSQGPSANKPYTLSENDCTGSGENPSFSTSMQSSKGLGHSGPLQDLHILQRSLSVQDIEKSGRKRRIDATMDTDDINEIDSNRIQKNPKVALEMEDSVSISEIFLVKNNEAEKVAGYASPRNWSYIFSKFSEAIKQKLFPSADKLKSKEVCFLEDMLGRRQKANKYETLCTELQSQKIHDHLGNLQQKRVAEARRLQQVLVYEQAKLQLLRLKHERLLEKVQLLHSGVQESQLLKLNSSPSLCPPGSRDVRYKENHLPSGSVDLGGESEEAYKKLLAKRQELGALDKKVKNMIKCFLSSCKIKGEPSFADTIVLVNDHLKKHGICRSIRLNLQVWEVDDLESKNCHHNLVLNYRHFLLQRFTVKVGPVSSIVTINKLNEVNIMKSFPNINAYTAFAFVFNAESARNLLSPKILALETQLTSFLLSNLLDVVEETQMARIELRNLIQTNFHSPCVERLDLQLHFIGFKTGCKLVLTLDMSSLNRGMYPSEILPSELLTGASETHTPPPHSQSLSLEITTAIRALKSGHSRIIRLCRCVSQEISGWDSVCLSMVGSKPYLRAHLIWVNPRNLPFDLLL